MKKSFTESDLTVSATEAACIENASTGSKLSSLSPKKNYTPSSAPALDKTFTASRYANLVDKFREKVRQQELERKRTLKRTFADYQISEVDRVPENDKVLGSLVSAFSKLKPAYEQGGGEAVEQGLIDFLFKKGIDKTIGEQGIEDFREALSSMASSARSFDPEIVASTFEKTGSAAEALDGLFGTLANGLAISKDVIFCISILTGIYSVYNAISRRSFFHSSVTGICLMVAYATAPTGANGMLGPFFSQLDSLLRGAQDDTPVEQVTNESLVTFTSVGVGMLAIACGFTTKSTEIAKFVLNYLKDYGRIRDSACDIITMIIQGFEKAINYFSRRWFGKTVTLLATGDASLDELIRNVEQIEMNMDLKKMAMTMEHYHKILEVEESLNKALLGLKAKSSTTELRNLLRSKLRKVEKIRDAFRSSSFTYDGFRQEPVAALFTGKPGQGKTQMMTFLSMALCARTLPEEELAGFRLNPDKYFYNRLFEQDFWDGYSSQWVCLFDDFAQIRDFAGREDSEIHNIVRAVNEHPYNLHMADLSDKSNTTFRSPFVLATSNCKLEDKDFESIKDPEAIRRRFDMMFDVRIKPQFLKEIDGGKYADPSKMPLGTRGVSCFGPELVEFFDVKSKRALTFEQIVERLVSMYNTKKLRYEQKRDQIDELVSESIEQRDREDDSDSEEDKSDGDESEDERKSKSSTRVKKFGKLFRRKKPAYQQGCDSDTDCEFEEALDDDRWEERIANLSMFRDKSKIARGCQKVKRTLASYRRELISRLEVTDAWNDVASVGYTISDQAKQWLSYFRERLSMGKSVRKHTQNFLDFCSDLVNEIFDDDTKPFMTLHAISEFCANLWDRVPDAVELDPRVWLRRVKEVGARSVRACWPCLESMSSKASSFGARVKACVANNSLISKLLKAAKFVAAISGFVALGFGLMKLFTYMSGPSEPTNVVPYIKSGGMLFYQGHPTYDILKASGVADSLTVNQETGKPVVPQNPVPQSFGLSDRMRDRSSLIKQYVGKAAVQQSYREFDPGTASIMDLVVSHNCYEFWFVASDGSWKQAGYAVVIRGRLAIAPTHFLFTLLDKLAEDKNYAQKNVKFIRKYPAKDGKEQVFEMAIWEWLAGISYDKKSSGRDWLMFIMPREAPMGRDILSKFVLEKHVEEAKGLPFSLVIPRRNDKTIISGTLGPLVYNHDVINGYGERRQIIRSYMYDGDTAAGDCGALLFSMNKNPPKGCILGFHIMGHSGDRKGFSTVITREMLDKKIALFPAEASVHETPNTVHELMGLAVTQPAVEQMFQERSVSGVFSPMYVIDPKVSHGGRSAIRKSMLHEKWGPALTAPARLHPFVKDGVEIDPYEKALAKYIQPFVPIPTDHIAIATTVYFQHLAHVSKAPRFKRVFTFDEAVQGFPDPVWSSISRATSAGFPYSDHPLFKGKGKARIWGTDGDYDLDTEQSRYIKAHCDRIIEDASKGIRNLHVFTDCLKDERRPLEKVDQGVTRLFSACPLDFLIVFRRYFGAFSIWFTENHVENGSAIGLNPYSTGWDMLAKKLETHGKSYRNGAGDHHHYDGSSRGAINWAILPFVNSWYDDGPVNARIREVLWYELINSRHVWGDLMLEWANGTPSGHPWTALINTMHNHILFILCFMHIFGNSYSVAATFYDLIYLIVLGDDNAFDVAEELGDKFDEASVANAMKQFGMVYTSELKGESQKGFRRLTEIEFLKRSFRYEESLGRYIAPLRLEVILEIPYWTKKGPQNRAIVLDNVQNALDELSLHGEEVFSEWAPKIISATQEMYSYTPPRTAYPVCKAFVLQREQFY